MLFGNYLLGGGFLNSRLATRIRVKDGLSYGVSSNVGAKSIEQDGQFQMLAIAAPQNVAKVEAAFKEEIDRVLKDGFTQQEVDAGRTGWTQSQQVGRSDDRTLAQLLGTRDFDNRTMSWDDELQNRVMSLTPDDIRAAMRRHLDVSKISIVKAGDFKKAAAGQ
jgi:zinc protease